MRQLYCRVFLRVYSNTRIVCGVAGDDDGDDVSWRGSNGDADQRDDGDEKIVVGVVSFGLQISSVVLWQTRCEGDVAV